MSQMSRFFPAAPWPVVGMVHVPAAPGTPRHDRRLSLAGAVAQVKKDVATLVAAGFDGLLFCNEHDGPYLLRGRESEKAALTRIVAEAKATIPAGMPWGVDFLWDADATLAIGAMTDAHYIRTVGAGTWGSNFGGWEVSPGDLLRERSRLGREAMGFFINATPEFASPADQRSPAEIARSIAVSSMPDALLVSGSEAGVSPELSLFAEIRAAVARADKKIPVLVNTGAKPENIKKFIELGADGVIVGSTLKENGETLNRLDPERAKHFVTTARSAVAEVAAARAAAARAA